MLSILNETKTKVFQQEQLTVRIFPSIQEMGSVAAKEVGDQICRLLESKPEINMIFAAAPLTKWPVFFILTKKKVL